MVDQEWEHIPDSSAGPILQRTAMVPGPTPTTMLTPAIGLLLSCFYTVNEIIERDCDCDTARFRGDGG